MDEDYGFMQVENLDYDEDKNNSSDEECVDEEEPEKSGNPGPSSAGLLGLRAMHLEVSNTPSIKSSSLKAEDFRSLPEGSVSQMVSSHILCSC